MSKLDKMIAKLCPDGVEYRRVGDIADYEQPSKYLVKSTDYNDDFEIPVLTAGQTFILGYTNEKEGIYNASSEKPVIIFDDFTGAFKWVDFPFKAKSSAMKMITSKSDVLIRYLFHLMGFLNYSSDEHKRLWISVYSELQVPVPPLEVQREIVHILDSFTLLTAELTAELTARKKQYEFYRDKLLSHDGDYPMKPLADLGKWSGGKTPSMSEKSFWEQGTIPWISSKDMKASTLVDTQDHITEKAVKEAFMTVYPANSIAVVTRSGILKHTFPVAYVPFETTINQDIKMLVVNEDILPRYAFHVIQGKGKDILVKTKKQGGTVDSLDFQKVLTYKVPVPSKDIQSRLVEVLDNFESICTDLNIGLPAEIEARQKQYEYYRDFIDKHNHDGEIVVVARSGASAGFVSYWNQKIFVTDGFGYEEIDKHNHDGEIVVVARSGASAGFVSYWNQKIFVTDGFGYEEKSELITTKFLYYVLKNMESELNAMKRGAGVPHISGEMLNSIELPIPLLQEQNRITDILDRFDTLCNDLSTGLPAEIEARQKQYEYYRDKLLSFKELPK